MPLHMVCPSKHYLFLTFAICADPFAGDGGVGVEGPAVAVQGHVGHALSVFAVDDVHVHGAVAAHSFHIAFHFSVELRAGGFQDGDLALLVVLQQRAVDVLFFNAALVGVSGLLFHRGFVSSTLLGGELGGESGGHRDISVRASRIGDLPEPGLDAQGLVTGPLQGLLRGGLTRFVGALLWWCRS